MRFLFKKEFNLIHIFFGVIAVRALNDGYYFTAFIFMLIGGFITVIFGDKYNPDKYTKEDIKKAFTAGRYELNCIKVALDEIFKDEASSQGFDIWSQREKDNDHES